MPSLAEMVSAISRGHPATRGSTGRRESDGGHRPRATAMSRTRRHRPNEQWHRALREAGHNATIIELMDHLDAQLKVYDSGTTTQPENLALIVEEHERILDAVRRGDAAAAGQYVIEHQSRTRDLRIAALARS
ncbi:hypothetical protein SHIRM173S_00861 [Streptomyces hirsutus]